jgi:WhiB family transcriptional regulator, redox-sensing transcriptional regulator
VTDDNPEPLWGTDPEPDLYGLLVEVARRLPWMSQAECGRRHPDGTLVHDPDLWHPEMGKPVEPAKAICAGCTVRDECERYAMETRQQFGVWGGLSVMDRRRIRKEGLLDE